MMRGMKALLGACMFVIAGLVALSTFSYTPSTSSKALHSIVSHTHQQLNQLHKLKEELEGDQPLDNTILTELGFIENPVFYPAHTWNNISTPVIISAISSLEFSLLGNLLKTCQSLASSNTSIFIFSLDLSTEEFKQLESECNDTCDIIAFDYDRYPSHVKDHKLGAYRPIIIQEMLQRSGAVIWIDPCIQMLESFDTLPTNSHSLFKKWGRKAIKNSGVLTWLLSYPASHLPTAALTHPDMFRSMGTLKKEYDFQKMSDPNLVYIINLPAIHQHLMRPWVRCALTSSCLSPIGAQETGCRYDKKPRFRYSGCHLYDSSAFNIALGLTYGLDKDYYIETTPVYECISSFEFERSQSTIMQEDESLMTQTTRITLSSKTNNSLLHKLPNFDTQKKIQRVAQPPDTTQKSVDLYSKNLNSSLTKTSKLIRTINGSSMSKRPTHSSTKTTKNIGSDHKNVISIKKVSGEQILNKSQDQKS